MKRSRRSFSQHRPRHAHPSMLAPTRSLAAVAGLAIFGAVAIAGCAAVASGRGAPAPRAVHPAAVVAPAAQALGAAQIGSGYAGLSPADIAAMRRSGSASAAMLAAAGGPGPAGHGADTAAVSGLAGSGIPSTALAAYKNAATREAGRQPACGLSWPLLAAIGRVESNHGRFAGAVLHTDGISTPRIIGIPLDGSGTALIRDTDGGRLDGDTVYDRAIGPMQFIPSTWAGWGVDANHDSVRDPFNVFDAAAAAADYLCAAGRDLTTAHGQVQAILSYNYSYDYVSMVMGLEKVYASGAVGVTVPVLPTTADPGHGRPAQRPPLPPVDPGPPRGATPPAGPDPVASSPHTPSPSQSTSVSHSKSPSQSPTTSPAPTKSPSQSPRTSPAPTCTSTSPNSSASTDGPSAGTPSPTTTLPACSTPTDPGSPSVGGGSSSSSGTADAAGTVGAADGAGSSVHSES